MPRAPRPSLFPYTTLFRSLVANLGYDKLIMPKPVFIGDTLRATSEVIGLKESKSRPNAGIVTFLHRDRKSTRLNSSHVKISYAVFCVKNKRGPTKRPCKIH